MIKRFRKFLYLIFSDRLISIRDYTYHRRDVVRVGKVIQSTPTSFYINVETIDGETHTLFDKTSDASHDRRNLFLRELELKYY